MRTINIKVITNAKKELVLEDGGRFKVYVKAPPIDGKANQAVIDLLAQFFGVKARDVEIAHGERNSVKVVKIYDEE